MKKAFRVIVVLGLAVMLNPGVLPAQQTGPGSQGGWYCPWMGGSGPGHQGGRGGWYCPWMKGPQTGPPVAQPGKPLSKSQARAMVEQHVQSNPNLKVGKVVEKNGVYEVEVVTQNGSLVDKIQVNKQTGWFRSVY